MPSDSFSNFCAWPLCLVLQERLRMNERGICPRSIQQRGRLSGGEKKRLALARTLLQQPRILIVDEITSALDGPAAAGLLQGLELFRQTRTLVVISHRPATILWADRIMVVDEGAIVDSGKHQELILRCEAYRRIWQSQDRMPSVSSSRVTWNGETTADAKIPASEQFR